MMKSKNVWITLCLINLSIVAFLGFVLRSKIIFSIPFIDYRSLISAHSHFAFAGWVGLSILTLFVYDLLAPQFASKKIYPLLLVATQLSAFGMLFSFPFGGYNAVSIVFSTLYIFTAYVFAAVFIKDFLRSKPGKSLKILGISSIVFLMLSALGPVGLSYILISKSANSILYRDSIYTFLHFQYNGFFTVAIFGLLFNRVKRQVDLNHKNVYLFSVFLVLSVVPALFLSLLWHNNFWFYIVASVAALLIMVSLFYLFKFFGMLVKTSNYTHKLARNFIVFALVSFVIKMALNIGTLHPDLGDAVYGNRPVIIGFLHLVFLGFVTFYLLSYFIEEQLFSARKKLLATPLYIFAFGIFANEALLGIQGLEILFKSNSKLYNWLLWGASIVLFIGAASIVFARFASSRSSKISANENAPQL